MRYIIAGTAFALVAGITLGFILSSGLDDSVSAAPPTQAVEEQNLDANGFIAVHEQGTADVAGTVDVGNLPLDGNGNLQVGSTPRFTSTAELFSGVINPGQTVRTPFAAVAGCLEFTVFILNAGQSGVGSIDDADLVVSADGVHPYGTVRSASRTNGLEGVQINLAARYSASPEVQSLVTVAPTTPFAGAEFRAPTSLPARTITVTLHCTG